MRICQQATCLVFAHRVKRRGQMASRDAVQRGGSNPLRTRSAVRTGNVVIFSHLSLSLLLFSFLSFFLWNTSMKENTYMYNPFMLVCVCAVCLGRALTDGETSFLINYFLQIGKDRTHRQGLHFMKHLYASAIT